MTLSPAAAVNAPLIGVAGGRRELATPALVVDRAGLMRNIAAMAAHCARAGIALRPHTKTHKCSAIARLQMEAGAVGICCAKLGEAEAMAAAGLDGILITSPIVADPALNRLAALNAACDGLIVVVDALPMVAKLAGAARLSGRVLKVLVDVDVGTHRTGAVPGDDVLAIAQAAAADDWLSFEGLQGYAGHVQHVADPHTRRQSSLKAVTRLGEMRDELTRRNLPPRVLSGGGTGSFDIDPGAAVLTELQAGSYVFMDREYNDVWSGAGVRPPFETSLWVQTTVISANHPLLATTDAGLKAFATDAGLPVLAAGAGPGASYFFFGDEQGGIRCTDPADRPSRGSVVSCVVPHCDPTVNLHDVLHIVEGDTLVDIWPIEARGRGF